MRANDTHVAIDDVTFADLYAAHYVLRGNGVASVMGSADAPQGYVIDRVSLPATDTAIATQILNSFVDRVSTPSTS